jgi:hypothetical protein
LLPASLAAIMLPVRITAAQWRFGLARADCTGA